MMRLKQLKGKECSEKKLKKIIGGNRLTNVGDADSNLAQCVFSLFKKC